jgi:hypothetical protein
MENKTNTNEAILARELIAVTEGIFLKQQQIQIEANDEIIKALDRFLVSVGKPDVFERMDVIEDQRQRWGEPEGAK